MYDRINFPGCNSMSVGEEKFEDTKGDYQKP
jgi:hypothetical protein